MTFTPMDLGNVLGRLLDHRQQEADTCPGCPMCAALCNVLILIDQSGELEASCGWLDAWAEDLAHGQCWDRFQNTNLLAAIDYHPAAPYEPTGKLKPIPANCLRY